MKMEERNLTVVTSKMCGEVECDFWKDGNSEDVFMTVNQLAQALGYSSRDGVEKIVSRNEYLRNEEFSVEVRMASTDMKYYNTRAFNKKGIMEVCKLSKVNNDLKVKLLEKINIDKKFIDMLINNGNKFIKQNTYINIIKRSFIHLKQEEQFKILNYRVDLYFPTLKLAIECDENNHNERNKKYEKKRQKEIEDVLSCKFIRFNPDSINFNIGVVINEILLESIK